MRTNRTFAKRLALILTVFGMSATGCIETPPSITAVDSGVDVMIDMSVPFVTTWVRFGNFVAGPRRSISVSKRRRIAHGPDLSFATWRCGQVACPI